MGIFFIKKNNKFNVSKNYYFTTLIKNLIYQKNRCRTWIKLTQLLIHLCLALTVCH